MIVVRRLFCAIALLAIICPLQTSYLCATKTKQQKLAQNQRKLRDALSDLASLYGRLAGKEIGDHRKDSYGRKWNRALKDIDKYSGKVRSYGGSPAARPGHYMSWDMMAGKVQWQSKEAEAAEEREEARKDVKRLEVKLTRYIRIAQTQIKKLDNASTKMSEKTRDDEVALYKKAYRKIVSNVNKINRLTKRYNGVAQEMPKLPAEPPVKVTVITEEQEKQREAADARKSIDKWVRKINAYEKAARRIATMLGNRRNRYSQNKVDKRKQQYGVALKKMQRNIEKARRLNTRFGLNMTIPSPQLSRHPEVNVQIVSAEDEKAEAADKHLGKMKRIIEILGNPSKSMSKEKVSAYKRKYNSEYRKAMFATKNNPVLNKKITAFPVPGRVNVKVSIVTEGDKAKQYVTKLTKLRNELNSGELTAAEITSTQNQYRKALTKLEKIDAGKAAPFKPMPTPTPAARSEDDNTARIEKLTTNLNAQLKILSKAELTQDEIDDAIGEYRRDYKKLRRMAPDQATKFSPEPKVTAKAIKPTARRDKFKKSLQEINAAIEKGVTQEQYNKLEQRFTSTKQKLNRLEEKHQLPLTTLGIAQANIKSDEEVIAQYRKELTALDDEIEDAGFFRIAAGVRSRKIDRRKKLAKLMRRAGHEPPPMPAYTKQDKKVAKINKDIESKKAEAARLREQGRTAQAEKVEQDIKLLKKDREFQQSNALNRAVRSKPSSRKPDKQDAAKAQAREARDEANTLKARAKDQRREADDILSQSGVSKEERKRAEDLLEAADRNEQTAKDKAEEAKVKEYESRSWLGRKLHRDPRKPHTDDDKKNEGGVSGAPSVGGGGMGGSMAAGGGAGMMTGGAAGAAMAPMAAPSAAPAPAAAPPVDPALAAQKAALLDGLEDDVDDAEQLSDDHEDRTDGIDDAAEERADLEEEQDQQLDPELQSLTHSLDSDEDDADDFEDSYDDDRSLDDFEEDDPAVAEETSGGSRDNPFSTNDTPRDNNNNNNDDGQNELRKPPPTHQSPTSTAGGYDDDDEGDDW